MRPLNSLGNRLCIREITRQLPGLGRHVLCRHPPRSVARLGQGMADRERTGARHHPNQTLVMDPEKGELLWPPTSAPLHRIPRLVRADPVDPVLPKIDPDTTDLVPGWPPPFCPSKSLTRNRGGSGAPSDCFCEPGVDGDASRAYSSEGPTRSGLQTIHWMACLTPFMSCRLRQDELIESQV